MKKLMVFLIALAMFLIPTGILSPAYAEASTTADVTVTATPSYIAISDNVVSYDFGVVATSSNASMPNGYVGITNASSVITNQTISVTSQNWTGGTQWISSDTATIGADTAGLRASKGTGAFDVIVKYAAPNNIAANQAATTDYTYEVRLMAPTSFSDGAQKTIVIRISAAAA